MTETAAWLAPLQSLIDRRLAASAQARELSRRIGGQTLALEFTGLGVTLYLTANDDGVSIDNVYRADPAAIVAGTPLAMMSLAQSDAGAEALHGGKVTMSGDTRAAQNFQKLLKLLRPDWEEELSRLIGDVAAHQVGNLARSIAGWSRDAADRLRADVGEFLTEESRDLPSASEVDIFLDGVDKLRSDVDRAEAKLRELTGRLAARER